MSHYPVVYTRPARAAPWPRTPGRPVPRGGLVRRTLDVAELGDWIDWVCQIDGALRLAEYREQAERVANAVGAPEAAVKILSQMVGAALGTQQVATSSKALTRARPRCRTTRIGCDY
jgi:hypothetical protein